MPWANPSPVMSFHCALAVMIGVGRSPRTTLILFVVEFDNPFSSVTVNFTLFVPLGRKVVICATVPRTESFRVHSKPVIAYPAG